MQFQLDGDRKEKKRKGDSPSVSALNKFGCNQMEIGKMYDVMLDEAKLCLDELKVESSSAPPVKEEDSGYEI